MDSHSAPTAQQRSQQIALPGQPGEQFLAAHDGLLRSVKRAVLPYRFDIAPTVKGIRIDGDDAAVMLASRIIEQVGNAAARKDVADASFLNSTISAVIANALKFDLAFRLTGLSYPIAPKSLNQFAYMQTLLSPSEQLVIGVGPTGTGKTHLAIAAALNQLAEERIKQIVVTRPHVVMEGEIVTSATRQELEADCQFEIFEDILRDLIGHHRFTALVEERKLVLVPLGQMRGRSFNNAFIILDEAQNMTVRKMRMAVTRIGRASRMVVTGDPTHIDLRGDETSGLVHLLSLLQGTDIAKVHHFENSQIVRNRIVARLEELYAGQQQTDQAFAA